MIKIKATPDMVQAVMNAADMPDRSNARAAIAEVLEIVAAELNEHAAELFEAWRDGDPGALQSEILSYEGGPC